MHGQKVAVLLAVLGALGCADDLETRTQGLAQPGFWAPPADILAQAEGYNIQNVQAGTWVGESGCGGSFLEGTRVFRQWLYDNYPQTTTIGGYACRPIANSTQMSVHATGRALDIMLPVDSTASPYNASADNDIGDPIANWLLEHAEEIGIQLIIWDNMIWSPTGNPRFRTYNNTNKHVDHIHMELNPEAAAMGTPWFKGPMSPPEMGPCGDPIPAEGGVIDDKDSCFQQFGPSQFWRVVEGQGNGGTLRWTNAWMSENPSNWARWRVELAEAGSYRVEFYNVKEFGVYDSAQYRVRHAGTEEDVYVDLSAADDGWNILGDFEFAAGGDQWVSVYDNAPVEVAADQHVIADAIRLTPPSAEPDPPATNVDPGPGTGGPNPDPPATGGNPPQTGEETDDGPEIIEAKGGCGCTSAGSAADPSAALLLLAFAFTRRRRG